MELLWSPWRMKYFSEKQAGCILCIVQKQPDGPDNLILFRGRRAFIILNRYPYTSGHVMVVSTVHKPSLEEVDAETRAEMMELATTCMRAIRQAYHPQGFNLGANIGEAAGAGVADHVHLHIVPRWTGDTNYMTTLGNVRVLPEELEDTYHRLLEAWKQVA